MKRLGAILAAGRGSRLMPFTEAVPKPLVPWLDGPMLLAAMRVLRAYGASRIAMNASYLSDEVVQWAKDSGEGPNHVVVETERLGTGGGALGMAAVLGLLAEERAILTLWNGDIVADVDLHAVESTLVGAGAIAALVTRDALPEERAIAVDDDGWVLSLPASRGRTWLRGDEVPVPTETALEFLTKKAASFRSFCGISMFRDDFFSAPGKLGDGRSGCILREGLGPLLGKGARIVSHAHGGFWGDLGTPERFAAVTMRALDSDLFRCVSSGRYRIVGDPNRRVYAHAESSGADNIDARDLVVGRGVHVSAVTEPVRGYCAFATPGSRVDVVPVSRTLTLDARSVILDRWPRDERRS